MASLDETVFVLCRGSEHVGVYDRSTFRRRSRLRVPTLGPCSYGIAACGTSRCLYVSDWCNDVVHRVNLYGDGAAVPAKWSTGKQPKALSVNGAGNVFVVCRSGPDTLNEYSPVGSLVRTIQLETVHTHHAIQIDGDRFLCSHGLDDGELHRVCVVDANGRVVAAYGDRASSSTLPLSYPCHVAVDGSGFVYVVDSGNRRIVVLSAALAWSRDIPIAEDRPRVVWVDRSRDRLYVGCNRGRLYKSDLYASSD